MRHLISFLASALLLASCASPPEGEFPSLSKRPFETADPIKEPEPKPVSVPESLPVAMASRVASLEARVNASDAAFNQRLPAARTRANAARGAERNSERWLAAHTQLSRLDKGRSDGVAALAEMDRLVTVQLEDQLRDGLPAYSQLLIPRQARMSEIIQSQNITIDLLTGTIGL